MEFIPDFLKEPLSYVIEGLVAIVAYLVRGKVIAMDKRVSEVERQLIEHALIANDAHFKLLEFKLSAKETYVDRVEYINSQNRIYDTLKIMSEDIKSLISDKADKD